MYIHTPENRRALALGRRHKVSLPYLRILEHVPFRPKRRGFDFGRQALAVVVRVHRGADFRAYSDKI